MKRTTIHILAAAVLVLGVSSCWQEEMKDLETGSDLQLRHQVMDLQATPGDAEVELRWTMPERWNPDGYQITYTNPDQTQTVLQETESSVLVSDLVNGYTYSFKVQAVYGELFSGVASVNATPVTSRIAVSDLTALAEDQSVVLNWTRPATTLLSYKLSWYMEDAEDQVQSVTLDKDLETYVLEGLTNDRNYFISLIGVYPKGESEPATVKVMPMNAQAFFLSRENVAVNQPVRFTFNTEAYPDAANVFWEFPGGIRKEGVEVDYGFGSAGEQQIVLHATINGVEQTWKMSVNVRTWVLFDDDFPTSGKYNGFKGSCPVFSPDGKTVYNITFAGYTNLLAYDVETGTRKWIYTVQHGSYNMATVNPVNGDIYFGTTTAGDFFCVSAAGEMKWQYEGLGSMQSAAPAVSKDGSTVYAVDATGNAVALDAASGAEKWKLALGAKGGGILVNGNEVLFGIVSKTGTLSFVNAATGEVIVRINCGANMTDISGFGISKDHQVAYLGHAGGGMSAVNIETHELLVNNKAVGTNNMYEPVVAPNGDVFLGSKDGKAYLVDGTTLETKASFDSGSGSNAFNYSHPAVDTDGNFYITAGQVSNKNFILGPDLTLKEMWQNDGANNKQMGGNNYLDGVLYSAYVGANGENGLFVGKYVGGTRYGSHGFDICGSCCIR